ncbi:hypothetical protein SLE2022_182050 [Rubroshorea leprosula]
MEKDGGEQVNSLFEAHNFSPYLQPHRRSSTGIPKSRPPFNHRDFRLSTNDFCKSNVSKLFPFPCAAKLCMIPPTLLPSSLRVTAASSPLFLPLSENPTSFSSSIVFSP